MRLINEYNYNIITNYNDIIVFYAFKNSQRRMKINLFRKQGGLVQSPVMLGAEQQKTQRQQVNDDDDDTVHVPGT